jgi:hypothetical protein
MKNSFSKRNNAPLQMEDALRSLVLYHCLSVMAAPTFVQEGPAIHDFACSNAEAG